VKETELLDEINKLHAEIDRLNQQLNQVTATRDRFFSVISHDLRSPFTGLLGLSEILSKSDPAFPEDRRIQIGKLLHTSVKHQHLLIQNLCEWAKFQQGKTFFNPERLNLRNVIQQCILNLESKISAYQLKVSNEIPETLFIQADAYMMKTSINHLVTNAVRFTPANGNIRIWLGQEDEMITINVEDNGIGFPPDKLLKVFELGSLVAGKDLYGEKGTGLGLLITRDYLKMNGIAIEIHSDPSSGTNVRLLISSKDIFFLKVT
jgi:signal transduction histidine kinase